MIRIFSLLVLIIAGAITFFQTNFIHKIIPSPDFFNPTYPHATIVIGSNQFDALVANTESLKEKGLGGFKSLTLKEAMLFPYDTPAKLSFWMKDMLFSIDILWLDSTFHVIHFEKDVSPSTYPNTFTSETPAQYVIEFSAGTLDRISVKEGDSVSISYQK